jgi:hypothetical protein
MQVSKSFQFVFALVIIANVCVWFYARPLQATWTNVPPAPSQFAAHATGLGDYDLSYRMIGFMLQNIGKVDGRTQALRTYDYKELVKWFFAAYALQPESNYVPMMATYYYGATPDREQARELIKFLKVAGSSPKGERWRWLIHAIFLARHKVGDMHLALEIAQVLRDMDSPNKPLWTNMMIALIKNDMNEKSEKEEAYLLMKSMLESSADKLHPAEVNFIIGYICERILTEEEAAKDKICELNKP